MDLRNNVIVTISMIVVFLIFVISASVGLELFVNSVSGPTVIRPKQIGANAVTSSSGKVVVPEESKFKNYLNKDFGFSFNYPENWELMSDKTDDLISDIRYVQIVERSVSSSKKAFSEMTPGDPLFFNKVLMINYVRNGNAKNLSPEEYFKGQGAIMPNTKVNPGIGGFPTYLSYYEKSFDHGKNVVAWYTIFKGKDVIGLTLDDRVAKTTVETLDLFKTTISQFAFQK